MPAEPAALRYQFDQWGYTERGLNLLSWRRRRLQAHYGQCHQPRQQCGDLAHFSLNANLHSVPGNG
jgi:hypothetical protein